MEQIKKIYYLSSTHWDREWYQSFQGFRYRLVNVTNNVIDTLEKDPAFTHFTFDGQTIVLDDYTKIEKGNRDRLITLVIKTGFFNVAIKNWTKENTTIPPDRRVFIWTYLNRLLHDVFFFCHF